MSGYNYGPPPPPPQASQPGHHGYGQHAGHHVQQHGTSRGVGGASSGRGRGGYPSGGRTEYQSSPSRYDYQQPYPAHTPGYAGSHQGSYPSGHQQWPQEHGHSPVTQQSHTPVPLSSANYHPNYAPHYTQGHAQPPAAHPPAYGGPPPPQPAQQYHYPTPAPYNAQAWPGHDRSQPLQYGGGHHRGGYGNERGGSRAPSMGAPVRAEYGSPGMQPQVSSGYVQPYPDPRAAVPVYPPQSQYQYPPAPPPPPQASTASGREPYNKRDGHHGAGRGRGGFRGGGNNSGPRGKQPHHGGDKMRPRHQGHQGHQSHQSHQGHRAENGGPRKHDQNSSGKKKKRKTNTLGLTPGQDSESEADEKEEETLQKLLGQDALQITDVSAYIAERRKNFPTASRAKAKKNTESAQVNGDKHAAALEKEEKMAEKLRRQLEKVESSIKRKREQQDEGDEMRGSPVSAVGSDDDQPEAMSTRANQHPSLPHSARRADISQHCKYFSTGGTCGKKGKCRFVHDPEIRAAAVKEREANNGLLTIQQRLVLNDKDQEDHTILQSIQYLRERGIVSKEKLLATESESATKGSQPHKTSSLPAAPASLPKPPVKREHALPPHNPPHSALQIAKTGGPVQYKGWNLSGYGNSGLKSEDLP